MSSVMIDSHAASGILTSGVRATTPAPAATASTIATKISSRESSVTVTGSPPVRRQHPLAPARAAVVRRLAGGEPAELEAVAEQLAALREVLVARELDDERGAARAGEQLPAAGQHADLGGLDVDL